MSNPMSGTQDPPIKTVSRLAFLQDPGLWLRLARRQRTTIAITEDGVPVAYLSVPGPR